MSQAWKKIDLEGGGLQAVNQRLSQLLRRRRLAYGLWLLFPLGAHRFYLESRRGGLVYLGLTVLSLAFWFGFGGEAAVLPLGAALLFALYDLFWIDRRITALNKTIRVRLYMGMDAAAPAGYAGRYTDTDEDLIETYSKEKEQERAGHQRISAPREYGEQKRAPSFAEQEAMLRELAKKRKKDQDD